MARVRFERTRVLHFALTIFAPKLHSDAEANGAGMMSEADRLLHNILEDGDIVGRDAAGRIVIQVAVGRRDFELLMTFGAVEVESECGGDDEPYECMPVSPCWLEDAARVMRLAGIPLH